MSAADSTTAAPNTTAMPSDAPSSEPAATTAAPTNTTLNAETSAVVPDGEEKKSEAETAAVRVLPLIYSTSL
jgi:hypothetical protein